MVIGVVCQSALLPQQVARAVHQPARRATAEHDVGFVRHGQLPPCPDHMRACRLAMLPSLPHSNRQGRVSPSSQRSACVAL